VRDNYTKLKRILREMFQMDQADLDFGIYRIMNQKRDEVEQFLETDLLPQVKTAFADYTSVDRLRIEEEINKVKKNLADAGVKPEDSPKYMELQGQVANAVDIEALEQEVYSHLLSFFSRYYDNGDFLSRPRYKDGVYAIPYKGEEVKLHWANADQYYIKTSEYFRDYTFKLPSGQRVHFKVVDASTEQNNNKEENGKERRFVLCDDEPFIEADNELLIRFEYKVDPGKQDKLNEKAIEYIQSNSDTKPVQSYMELFTPCPTEANPQRTLLEKHLKEYTARNTFDYFIHKDLGGFLRRELDFYIKNEVLFIDDIDERDPLFFQQSLSKVKVIKNIAQKIIAFLEQLENFQKMLWLKKKFVVETNYCITLDRLPEELYEEIIANKNQIEEWKRLFSIQDIEQSDTNPAYTEPLTVDFLKANPYLVIDTVFFGEDFKNRLLSSFENIDEATDGLLIHSENFQALNFLQERYKEQVKCIYIDPPYNTDSTPIVYKNGYKHSSWLSLIKDRIQLSQILINRTSVYVVAIDDTEANNFMLLLNCMFNNHRISPITVVHNPKGSITKDFNRVHEYAVVITNEDEKNSITRTLEKNETPRKMRRWGANSLRTERRLSFYPIYIKDGQITRIGEIPSDNFHPSGKNVKLETGEIEVWPIDQDGIERRWNFGLDTINDNLNRIEIIEKEGVFDLFVTHEFTVPKTVWTGGMYDAGNYGNTLLINILGIKLFDFPKSINTVKQSVYLATSNYKNTTILDYFAGSGTTGHAVINLNREDKGTRKYILVEMGEYFDTVLKPRIQKVIYSKDWKNGKPVSREGSSHMFKYMRLESYEDALNNLEMQRSAMQQQVLGENARVREQYMLSYMLDVESQGSVSLLNLENFADPFNYKLNIYRNGESRPVNVDLIETFNYLLGLKVRQTELIRGFRVVRGELLNGDKVLIIWRNLKEKSNEELDKFFDKQGYSTADLEFDRVYVNGDNNLQNWKKDEDLWKVFLIEEEFKRLMFEASDI